MTGGMVFNSRLFPPDISQWHDMCREIGIEGLERLRECTDSFGQLEDALMYVATLGDKSVGGTALYRDRTRLGLALATVLIDEEHRDTLLSSMIRSSLPFFRTAAIRQVYALVASDAGDDEQSPSDARPPFPFSFVLPSWYDDVLARLRFHEVEELSLIHI